MNLKLKNDRRESKTNASGITLIALVVTIVVLLILAGISLNLVLGSNGIIAKAKDAKNKTEQDKINTETALNTLYDEIVAAEGGSSSGSAGTTHTWERKSFKVSYVKNDGEQATEWTEKTITLYNSNVLYSELLFNQSSNKFEGVKCNRTFTNVMNVDTGSIGECDLIRHPFMQGMTVICGQCVTTVMQYINNSFTCTPNQCGQYSRTARYKYVPTNVEGVIVEEGNYVYETFESSDPTLEEGFKDGYWYKKVN